MTQTHTWYVLSREPIAGEKRMVLARVQGQRKARQYAAKHNGVVRTVEQFQDLADAGKIWQARNA